MELLAGPLGISEIELFKLAGYLSEDGAEVKIFRIAGFIGGKQ